MTTLLRNTPGGVWRRLSALAIGLIGAVGSAVAQSEPAQAPQPLRPRVVFSGHGIQMPRSAEDAGTVVLKFREGSRVRIRDGRLTAAAERLSDADARLLRRAALTKAQV